ncbi:hypothetical protein Plhal703r1_c07g0041991 [Plasmopara halstedii]
MYCAASFVKQVVKPPRCRFFKAHCYALTQTTHVIIRVIGKDTAKQFLTKCFTIMVCR